MLPFCDMVPVPGDLALGLALEGGVVDCDSTCSLPFALEISVIVSVLDDDDGILKSTSISGSLFGTECGEWCFLIWSTMVLLESAIGHINDVG